jgi:hypothetical protein
MAYGFGVTYGTGAGADLISLPTSFTPTSNATYHFRCFLAATGGGGLGRIFHWADNANINGPGLCLYDSTLSFQLNTSGTTGQWHIAIDAASLNNKWIDVVIVQSGTSTPVIYVDGVSQTVTVDVAATGTAYVTAGTAFRIGNRGDSTRELGGMVAEMAYWSRILGAVEIDFLADGGAPDCIVNSLELYAPLIRDVVNLKDNSSPTTTGALVQPHPRVYSSDQATFSAVPAAVVADTLFAQSWM